MHKEIARLEGLYKKEIKLWQEIKTRYEVTTNSNDAKIQHLKTALEEIKAKIEMNTERNLATFAQEQVHMKI